jgi:tRNA A37 N6-isopentenylltransferase MiaA
MHDEVARMPAAEESRVARRPELLVICGPTAAGKTALAVALAGELDLVVINADSRQIYRGFDIGTAKPSAAERRVVPHQCIDLAGPATRFTAYAWAAAAEAAIAGARREGRIPVVVGGAGFYIRALVHPVSDEAPAGAERYAAHYLVTDPGLVLRERIAERAARMLDGGWAEEVASLAAHVPPDAPAWQASGYSAIREYVAGTIARDAALGRVAIATRQYAKRQRTWFRHQLPAHRTTRLDPDDTSAVRAASAWVRDHSGDPSGDRTPRTTPFRERVPA